MPAVGRRESGAAAFARPVVRELVERPRSVTRSNTGERSPQPSVGSGAASHSGTAVSNFSRRTPKELAQELLNAASSGGSRSSKSGATHGAGGGGGGESSGSGGGCGGGCSAASTCSAGVAERVSAAFDTLSSLGSLSPRFPQLSQRLEPIESSPHSTGSSLFRRSQYEPGGRRGGRGEAKVEEIDARVLPSSSASGRSPVEEAAGEAAGGDVEDASRRWAAMWERRRAAILKHAAAVASGEFALSSAVGGAEDAAKDAVDEAVDAVDIARAISWGRLANQDSRPPSANQDSRPPSVEPSPRESRAPMQAVLAEPGSDTRVMAEPGSDTRRSASACSSVTGGCTPQSDGVRLSGYLWKKGLSWLSFSYRRRLVYLRQDELCFVPPPASAAAGLCSTLTPCASSSTSSCSTSSTSRRSREEDDKHEEQHERHHCRIPLGTILKVRVRSKAKFEFELVCASRRTSCRLRAPSAQELAVWVTTISAAWCDVLQREANASGDFAAGEVLSSAQAGGDEMFLQGRDVLS